CRVDERRRDLQDRPRPLRDRPDRVGRSRQRRVGGVRAARGSRAAAGARAQRGCGPVGARVGADDVLAGAGGGGGQHAATPARAGHAAAPARTGRGIGPRIKSEGSCSVSDLATGLMFEEPPPVPDTANFLLYGPPKSGKSTAAATAPGPILWVSAEGPGALAF